MDLVDTIIKRLQKQIRRIREDSASQDGDDEGESDDEIKELKHKSR